MKTLNFIGCGRVGRTLGRLWISGGIFAIQDVLTRSAESAADAVRFIGAGRAVADLMVMRPADIWLVATPDNDIAESAARLAQSGLLRPGDIVFHVSGATPSSALDPVVQHGALATSVHPIKTFVDATTAAATFANTYCSAEGTAAALEVLRPAFEAVGAIVFDIHPELKAVYHSGGVFACNYLAVLIEMALACHERAGIPRQTSLQAIAPMVRETVEAVFRDGPARALTGPVTRGDATTVAREAAALEAWQPPFAVLYRELAGVALDLVRAAGRLDDENFERLAAVLHKSTPKT
jgi:predicted short-subunit dehydrogenase-like oxidoreductase (DUF2520 family)